MAMDSRGLSTTSSRALLARILDQPDLPAQVERLPPALLGKLIDRIGLEDAGEILCLASTDQIAQIFDDDLWKNERPGDVERFDAERFLLWLEVMLEAGERFVAQKLVELPEDLVTLAFHRHLLVIDIEAMAVEMAEGGEEAWQLEKALESTLHEELGEYRLIARRHDGWDTLLTAILALDKDHHDTLFKILERCCAMSTEHIEDNGGLYEVLTSEEMLEADVAGDREDRRAEGGYVSPSTAASFLKLARTDEGAAADTRDPVTRAYFRGLTRAPLAAKKGAGEADDDAAPGASDRRALPRSASPSAPSSKPVPSLQRVLAEAGLTEESQVGRLLSAGATAEEPLVVRAMRVLGESHPALFADRSEELAYLANVLVSGASFRGRRFRPIEALRAAIAACSFGLHLWTRRALPTDETVREAAACLEKVTADGLFRLAHHRLHRDLVSVAKAAEARLLAGLDVPKADALRALAEDCPSLAGALVRRVDETRPETDDDPARFVSTPTELAAALQFLAALEATPRPPTPEDLAEQALFGPPSPRKAPPKESPADKAPPHKAPARKPTPRKSATKKPATKKSAPKKSAPKKPAAKKPSTRTPAPGKVKRTKKA